VATARTFKTEEVLSGADFVYSFEQGDFVYFLFKETALEEEREVRSLRFQKQGKFLELLFCIFSHVMDYSFRDMVCIL
jgi:hypothetical protein